MLTHRLATEEDLPALADLMARAIDSLQRGFLTDAQMRIPTMPVGYSDLIPATIPI